MRWTFNPEDVGSIPTEDTWHLCTQINSEMMILADESYKDEAPYLYEGEVPRSDRPGVFSRIASRFSGGELHPDASNKEVEAPSLEDEPEGDEE